MLKIENLGKDKFDFVSSQPAIKSGKNKGKRLPEKNGNWIYCGGYCYEARWSEKNANITWLLAMQKIGFRTGKYELDGVVNLYIFVKNETVE